MQRGIAAHPSFISKRACALALRGCHSVERWAVPVVGVRQRRQAGAAAAQRLQAGARAHRGRDPHRERVRLRAGRGREVVLERELDGGWQAGLAEVRRAGSGGDALRTGRAGTEHRSAAARDPSMHQQRAG